MMHYPLGWLEDLEKADPFGGLGHLPPKISKIEIISCILGQVSGISSNFSFLYL